MTWKECLSLMRADRSRFNVDRTGRFVSVSFTTVFRVGSYMSSKNSWLLYLPLWIIRIIYFFMKLATGIQLPLGTDVKGGLRFPHYSCIVIAGRCKIGSNCTIHQGVTLGQSHFGKHQGFPIVGNNVLIYAGAKICGGIRIGNNVVIGSNAVITNDIPDNCVVVGHNKIVSADSYNFMGDKGRSIFW